MDYVLLILAIVILVQVETYDGNRPCKMDSRKSAYSLRRADPRSTLLQDVAVVADSRGKVRGAQCPDKTAQAGDDGRAPGESAGHTRGQR